MINFLTLNSSKMNTKIKLFLFFLLVTTSSRIFCQNTTNHKGTLILGESHYDFSMILKKGNNSSISADVTYTLVELGSNGKRNLIGKKASQKLRGYKTEGTIGLVSYTLDNKYNILPKLNSYDIFITEQNNQYTAKFANNIGEFKFTPPKPKTKPIITPKLEIEDTVVIAEVPKDSTTVEQEPIITPSTTDDDDTLKKKPKPKPVPYPIYTPSKIEFNKTYISMGVGLINFQYQDFTNFDLSDYQYYPNAQDRIFVPLESFIDDPTLLAFNISTITGISDLMYTGLRLSFAPNQSANEMYFLSLNAYFGYRFFDSDNFLLALEPNVGYGIGSVDLGKAELIEGFQFPGLFVETEEGRIYPNSDLSLELNSINVGLDLAGFYKINENLLFKATIGYTQSFGHSFVMTFTQNDEEIELDLSNSNATMTPESRPIIPVQNKVEPRIKLKGLNYSIGICFGLDI